MKKQRATLKDVAQAVGVHVSTVSRALSPQTRNLITDEMVDKIIKTAKELDYRPNSSAYSLRTKRSMAVGVIIPDITNPIFPPIVRGIEDSLSPNGYMALIVNTDGDPAQEVNLIELLRARGVDGLILASPLLQDESITQLVQQNILAITVNRMVDDLAVSSVINDDVSGIEQSVAYVASLGHRRIAHIAGPMNSSTGRIRYDAFCASAKKHKLEDWRDLIVHSNDYREEEGARCTLELIDSGLQFTAIVAANDLIALGAIESLRNRNLACPQDVSVIGYNDILLMDRVQPPMTTVRIQGYEAGKHAAMVFLDQIAKPIDDRKPIHEVLPVELITRGTTAPPRQ